MFDLSVIMATYNENGKFLRESIDSVLNQTYENFEFIIVVEPYETNIDFLENIAGTDNRIKILRNEKRLGVAGSRNRGIIESVGQYIALIDGDDCCDLSRFEKQLLFLRENSNISIAGSNMLMVDENNGVIGGRRYPETFGDIKKKFLLTMSVANPTVMIRRKDLEEVGLFDVQYQKAEDFELWLRFLAKGKQMCNLQENLVYYRIQKKDDDRRGPIHWRNNYSARKKYSKLIWPLHRRFISLLIFFIISNSPQVLSDGIVNSIIVQKIKRLKLQ